MRQGPRTPPKQLSQHTTPASSHEFAVVVGVPVTVVVFVIVDVADVVVAVVSIVVSAVVAARLRV